ncbi:hypothetical protein ACN6KF_003067 [Labrys sp. La1]|uniref:hypothetical protein n=1 Tax=Labrys sp. La1 TaxID=3404917 RepID=UPI003EBC80F8
MDITTIGLVLNIILNLVQNLTDNKTVDKIVTLLEQWIPVILKEAQDLIPVVTGIIATLQGNDVLTPEQVATIDALNAKVDADFDKASARFRTGGAT